MLAHSDGDETVRQSVAMFSTAPRSSSHKAAQWSSWTFRLMTCSRLWTSAAEDRSDPDEQDIDESVEPANLHHARTISFHEPAKGRSHAAVRSAQPPGYREVPFNVSHPKMFSSWHRLAPESRYWSPRLLHSLWKPKEIYITENGCAASDVVAADGNV